jgi:hypothetical protein
MRGITISIFILCVAVFGGFLAASGANDHLGVGMKTGLQDEAEQVNQSVGGDQNLSERGGNSGMLGFSVFALKQLAVLFLLPSSIMSVLTSWGMPVSLASGIEMLARVIQGFVGIWIARGMNGE